MKTCGTCRHVRALSGGDIGVRHECHERPPTVMLLMLRPTGPDVPHDAPVTQELRTYYPIVRPDNPEFACDRHARRGIVAAVLRRLFSVAR